MKIASTIIFFLCVLVSFGSTQVMAGPQEDAVSLTEEAAVFARANNLAKTCEELNNPSGMFVKDELYVFALDYDGIMKAHPKNKLFINEDVFDNKDAEGARYIKNAIYVARTKGKGWIDYKAVEKESRFIVPKRIYVTNVPERQIVLGCEVDK